MELTTSWQYADGGTYNNVGGSNVHANTRLYLRYDNRDISNNRDTIYWQIRAVATPDKSWASYGYGYDESYSIYDGSTARASGVHREGNYPNDPVTNTERVVASGSWVQPHNADGNWSTTLTYNGHVYGSAYTRYISVSLPMIPRKATISTAPDFNDEENPTITYSNPAGTAVNSLQACISFDGLGTDNISYRDIPKDGNSYTFGLTNAERTILRQACTENTKTVCFYIKTVIGSLTGWSASGARTLSIINANPTFNNFTFADTNSTTVALTGNNQNIIKGYSNITTTVSVANKATANKEATMSKYQFACGNSTAEANYSSSSAVSMTINNVPNGLFNVFAIDSRNNSTPVSKLANTVIEYTDVQKGNIGASRSNGVSKATTLTFNGTWWNDTFGSVNNAITAKYKYKKTSESSYPSATTALTLTTSGNNYSFNGLIAGDEGAEGFDINYSYDIQVIVEDELSSVTFTTQLASGIPHIAYAKNGVSIMGKYNDSVGGLLQVGGQRIDNADSLPIGSIVDYDGNTVPSGYEQVTENRTLLWQNESPNVAFTEQTITLSSSNYDELEIYYKEVASNNYIYSSKFLKNYGTKISCVFAPSDVGVAVYSREVQRTNDTQFFITNARYYYGDNTKGELNTILIPINVYGIKY